MKTKKQYTILLFLLIYNLGVSQISGGNNQNITMPDIIPPSPSVASLMKFEEIPVDYYTGTPSIGLPLYQFQLDEKLKLDIGLIYSQSGIKIDDIPGWAGTGWALNIGGSISRTMMGRADDDFRGIFNNGFFNIDNFTSEEKQTFLWNANRFKWDTEHDLFQYSFMGRTGRFYLKKDVVTGQIIPYDMNKQNNHKIMVELATTTNKILNFTITDELGYKYIFTFKDTTTAISNYQSIEPYDQYFSAWHLTEIRSPNNKLLCQFNYTTLTESSRTPTNYTYNNLMGQPITNIPYIENETIAYLPAVSSSFSSITNLVSVVNEIVVPNKGKVLFSTLSRTQTLNHTIINYAGYKLKDIRIQDASENLIKEFKFSINPIGSSEKIFLTQIEEKHPESESLLYKFNYLSPQNLPVFDSTTKDYWGYYNSNETNTLSPYNGADRNVDPNKVKTGVLESIEYPTGGKKVFEFESNTFSYVGDRLLDPTNSEEIPENLTSSFKAWNVLSSDVTNNKIVHFEGTQNISIYFKALSFNINNRADITGFRLLITPVVPNFYINPNGPVQEFDPQAFTEEDNNNILSRNFHSINISDCGSFLEIDECIKSIILKGWYSIRLVQDNYLASNPVTYSISFYYKKMTGNLKYTLGGGLRIKKIKFTDRDQNISEILYNYNMLSDNSISSGSQLLKPKKQGYTINRDLVYYFTANQGQNFCFLSDQATYFIYDNQNGLETPFDKGSYVGYKNVSVSNVTSNFTVPNDPFVPIYEINTPIGGKKEFIYTSPIDFSDYDTNIEWQYPFSKNPSNEFKRGLLLESRIYDESTRLLTKEINEYSYSSALINLGFTQKEKPFLDCPIVNEYSSYSAFKEGVIYRYRNENFECSLYATIHPYEYGLNIWNNYFNQGDVYSSGNAANLCPKATRYLYQLENTQVIGWAKLDRKTIYNYFYQANQSNEVLQEQTYSYNSDRLLKSIITEIGNNNFHQTNYFYPKDNEVVNEPFRNELIAKNIVSQPLLTENFQNGEPQFSEKIVYNQWSNGSLFKNKIQTSKGGFSLENRIRFNSYDDYENLIELQQENGTLISYIWGYNHTQPVAKIENIAYNSIPTNLITAIHSATNESAMFSALTALRNHSALANAMVSTYTYVPLVGVKTMTDPKGYTMTYHYDAFNRLEKVTDMEGNILSENEYHYRTQN